MDEPLHHVQHGDRGRRQERHRRLRRDDDAVPAEPAGGQPRAYRGPGVRQRPRTPSTRRSSRSTPPPSQPTVSKPHLPTNTAAAAELARRHASTRSSSAAAPTAASRTCVRRPSILRGRKVHPDVRCIILPGTQQVCLEAIADGTMQTLHRGRLRLQHAHLRAVPRRPHGRPGRGRARRVHHQPQLRRPHGPPRRARSTWRARYVAAASAWPATSPRPTKSAPAKGGSR